MTFHRYVALGDSFTEGVGDPDPERPNGLRGWADRVAEVLATRADDFGYANLAIRGRKLDGILAEQVEPALALEPDLVTIYAGANDIMRPRVDLDALADRVRRRAGPARRDRRPPPGVDGVRPGGSAIYRPVRGRFALYNELVREVADRNGATVVDFWRMREYRDWRYWDTDRMHMGPAGHQRMAIAVLDTLRVPHATPVPDCHRPRPSPRASSARRTSRGPARSPSRGCTAGSPGGPAATRSALGGRTSGPSSSICAAHLRARTADVAQLVERDLPKVDVASSNLVIRSRSPKHRLR